MLVTIDTKNACNTIKWTNILAEIRERRIIFKMVRLIDNYLSKRKIVVTNTFETIERYVYAEVLQCIEPR